MKLTITYALKSRVQTLFHILREGRMLAMQAISLPWAKTPSAENLCVTIQQEKIHVHNSSLKPLAFNLHIFINYCKLRLSFQPSGGFVRPRYSPPLTAVRTGLKACPLPVAPERVKCQLNVLINMQMKTMFHMHN